MKEQTIAGLAKAAAVGVETIRYYQRRGLMNEPPPSGGNGLKGGIRRYGREDLRRLRFIRSAQAAGFTLDQIAELIELDSTHDRTRALDLANERLSALDRKIEELLRARAALQHLAHECKSGDAGPCPSIAAFDEH